MGRSSLHEGQSLLLSSRRYTYSTGMRDSTRRSNEVFDRLVESGVGIINAPAASEVQYEEQSELYIARAHQVAREPPLFTARRGTADCTDMENHNATDVAPLFGDVSAEHETVCAYIDHVDKLRDYDNDPPRPFLCPVTLRAMRKPTIAADGHTYEYDSIVAALGRRPGISPTTNAAMRHVDLVPNYALKSLMEWWARHHAEIGLTNTLSQLTIRCGQEAKV
tara:strand:+ start:6775 stop:7440 length:666 start_codon:yes stop_codon:yes gene_type:complete